jgi:dsRNA-specific ribonuclease
LKSEQNVHGIRRGRLLKSHRKEPKMDDMEYEQRLAEVANFIGMGVTPELRLAFVTKSIDPDVDQNNERLEFMGDAVLDMVAAEIVMSAFPRKPEGYLTEKRANFTNNLTLAAIVTHYKWDALIMTRDPHTPKMYGSVLEAIIAALYMTEGLVAAGDFIQRLYDFHLTNPDLKKIAVRMRAKSIVQEWVDTHRIRQSDKVTPRNYTVQQVGGTPNAPIFRAKLRLPAVRLRDLNIDIQPPEFTADARGSGKDAEISAAVAAVSWIKREMKKHGLPME